MALMGEAYGKGVDTETTYIGRGKVPEFLSVSGFLVVFRVLLFALQEAANEKHTRGPRNEIAIGDPFSHT